MKLKKIFVVVLLLIGGNALSGDVWWEEPGEEYDFDLSGYRFLILLGDDFDYEETVWTKNYWETWGAKVEIAGTDKELTGHRWRRTDKGWERFENRKIKSDLFIDEVDINSYQAIYLPGGDSPKNLLEHQGAKVIKLITSASKQGLILAAICHGPSALAAAGVIKGRKITGHPEIVSEIQKAGGEYVKEVCIADGNIITANWPYFGTLAIKVAEKLLYPLGGAPSESSPFTTNPVLNAIKERRSIRVFKDKDVDEVTVNLLLKAASWAPSSNNEQPWIFVIVRDKSVKEKIVAAIMERMADYYKRREIPPDRVEVFISKILEAPVHIFAFCDDRSIGDEWRDIEMLWNVQGVATACQNMHLAAHAMGLGSLWFGLALVVEDEIKKMLEVPEGLRLVTVIALGYPVDKPLPPVRLLPSHFSFVEKFGNQ